MSTALSNTMSLEDLEECALINKKEVEKCNVDTCHKVYNAIKQKNMILKKRSEKVSYIAYINGSMRWEFVRVG